MEARSLAEEAASTAARLLANSRAVRAVVVEADMTADREARLERCDRPESDDGHEQLSTSLAEEIEEPAKVRDE